MEKRRSVKAREQFNEDAARGRRRHNVHNESTRQRDVNLRARRLATELSGGANGDLAALGPDVLAKRLREQAAALKQWPVAAPDEQLRVLQEVVTLLSTGVYQAVEAAVECGVVPCLEGILQQPDAQLPPGAARTAACALELIASSSDKSARAVLPAVSALAGRLGAAMAALGCCGCGTDAAAPREAVLAEASQLAGAIGAVAGWGLELQRHLEHAGVPDLLLQLLLATLDGAAAVASPAMVAAAQVMAAVATAPHQQQQPLSLPLLQPEQVAVLQPGPDPVEVQCCSTALWAIGMMVRERSEAEMQLVSQPALVAALCRVLLAPAAPLELLRGVAWVLAFCTSPCSGAAAVATLVDGGGGLLPGLLLSTTRVASYAAALKAATTTGGSGGGGGDDDGGPEDPALTAAAQPLRQALLPLLYAVANIAADPAHTLMVLSELQAARPLHSGGPSATGMEALLACLRNQVGHRRAQSGAAGLAAALAGGACAAGPAAVGATRNTLRSAGVTSALEWLLLRGGAMDVRREAAMALALLVEGAGGGGGGSDRGEAGNDPRPGRVAMLRELGVTRRRDERGVLAAFLGLVRSASADAVHAGLRFVTVVLAELRPGARVLVEELDGIDALEEAQEGRNGLNAPDLQAWAQGLVDDNWGIDVDEDAEGDGEEEDGDGEMEG